MGAMSKESVFELLDYFHSQGGNFLDTSNNYQCEQSEMWVGECKYFQSSPFFSNKALSLETRLGNVTLSGRVPRLAIPLQRDQTDSESLNLGMHKHPGIRDQMVIATKYTTSFSSYKGHDGIIQSNTGGNGSKSLHVSIRNSLHKLKTDYIDVLYVQYVHFADDLSNFLLQSSRKTCFRSK